MLHNIRVASPCSADWNKMEGNDRVRFCSACQLNVYNFSAMTEREIRRLIQDHEGRRLCGRLYRRKDGTILTRNCPVGLRAVVRRLSRVAGAILSFMTPVFAAAQPNGYVKNNVSSAALEVYVIDPQGIAVANAEVSLIQAGSDKPMNGKTDSKGRLRLLRYAGGDYVLKVRSSGFMDFQRHVQLRSGETLSLRTVLMLPGLTGVITIDDEPLLDSNSVVSHNLLDH